MSAPHDNVASRNTSRVDKAKETAILVANDDALTKFMGKITIAYGYIKLPPLADSKERDVK
jgi:hypothetical protein